MKRMRISIALGATLVSVAVLALGPAATPAAQLVAPSENAVV